MPADLHHHRLIGYRFITNKPHPPLILNDHGEQLTVEMPGQLISNDIDVMADGIRHGLGIGRLFEANPCNYSPIVSSLFRDGGLLENPIRQFISITQKTRRQNEKGESPD